MLAALIVNNSIQIKALDHSSLVSWKAPLKMYISTSIVVQRTKNWAFVFKNVNWRNYHFLAMLY